MTRGSGTTTTRDSSRSDEEERMNRKAFALVVVALLVALAVGVGRAHAAGGTYRIPAGGNQDWGPESGAIDQTADDKVEATGTMVSTESRSGSNGHADY